MNKKIPVYGYVVCGEGKGAHLGNKRLIALADSDLQAENVYRQWKRLNTAQKFEWVRNMAKAKGGVA